MFLMRTRRYLGAGIVKNARLWLVGLHRGRVDDGAALLHVLGCMLRYSKVCQDVGVECKLQSGPADLLKLVDLLALESSIVDQNVDAAPLLHCLIHNVPACIGVEMAVIQVSIASICCDMYTS